MADNKAGLVLSFAARCSLLELPQTVSHRLAARRPAARHKLAWEAKKHGSSSLVSLLMSPSCRPAATQS